MKTIVRLPLLSLLALAMASSLSSCATSVARVDSSQFRSTMGLDPQDVREVSAEMAESMLAANVLKRKGADGRSIIVISNFRNNTALYDFDPGMIYNSIRVTLNKSGVAYCYVKSGDDAYVAGNRSYVRGENEVRDFLGEGRISSGPSPQYSITLGLIEDATYQGNRTQKAYQIHMTLNRIGSGLSLWEDIRYIDKLKRRATIGL